MDCETSKLELLENMLSDEISEPTDLPISLLRTITKNFSDDLQIGIGGFAAVYKGFLRNGRTVAVKKLFDSIDMDETKYNQEVGCLMRVRHKNIVRFLGYCADAHGKLLDFEGKFIMADVRHRLLCFEYLPNGSLHDYITDASHGLEWGKRYKIVKGISEGLCHLHELRIVHLDLKPANILLDDNMVPKISDFGLSRRFDENQTRTMTSRLYGSLGYLAPEFYSGVITFKSDIYSLGVIYMEILTGQKGYSLVDDVLQNWRNRFDISSAETLLEQVRVCMEISIECMDPVPAKRPVIQSIIQRLKETEKTEQFILSSMSTSSTPQLQEEVHAGLTRSLPYMLRPCNPATALVVGALASIPTSVQSIGVCYGVVGNNLPSRSDVVQLYRSRGINGMRIYFPDKQALDALRGSGIALMLDTGNDMLGQLASSPSSAASWVQSNVRPYYDPAVNIKYIAVGNEVQGGAARRSILPAMRNLNAALAAEGLGSAIKVSTAVQFDVIANSFPPSSGVFAQGYMADIARYLASTGAPLLANVYPYFAYIHNQRAISLGYATFQPGTAVRDNNNGLMYTNLFDAMVDAIYAALEKAGAEGVRVVVSESGWPSAGGFGASVENAQSYNQGLVDHVGRGTPRRPGPLEAFIFAMFNENQKNGGPTERNFGLFYPNKQPVYPISF